MGCEIVNRITLQEENLIFSKENGRNDKRLLDVLLITPHLLFIAFGVLYIFLKDVNLYLAGIPIYIGLYIWSLSAMTRKYFMLKIQYLSTENHPIIIDGLNKSIDSKLDTFKKIHDFVFFAYIGPVVQFKRKIRISVSFISEENITELDKVSINNIVITDIKTYNLLSGSNRLRLCNGIIIIDEAENKIEVLECFKVFVGDIYPIHRKLFGESSYYSDEITYTCLKKILKTKKIDNDKEV